jgi:hypothetical protein
MNPANFLRISAESQNSNTVIVTHDARPTRAYRLQTSTNLFGAWQPIATNFIAPAANSLAWPATATNAIQFHRIEVRRP